MEAGPPDPLREVAAQDPNAAELLEVLAHFASRPIPLELVDAALPEASAQERRDALAALAGLGGVELGKGTVVVAADLAAAVRGSLPEQVLDGARLVGELLLASFPADPADPASWPAAGRLLPHLVQIADLGGLDPESAPLSLLLARGAEYSRVRGDLEAAEAMARRALSSCPPGADRDVVAQLDYTLGRALGARGYLGEALERLALARDVWGSEEEEAAPRQLRLSALALAEVRGQLGELEAALGLAREACSAGEPDRLDCIALRRIAWVAMEGGDLEEAEERYRDALSRTEDLLGPDHPDLAEARGELGALLVEQNRWGDAAEELQVALALALRLLGERHPLVGVIRSNLAAALEGLEELPRARAEVVESLSIGEERLPPGHRSLWLRHRKLRRILRDLGDRADAREHAAHAARLSEEVLGAAHPEHAADLLALAELLAEEGQMEGAAAALEEAVSVFRASGPEHLPQLAAARRGLGTAKASLGVPGQALVALRSALEDYVGLEDEDGAVDVRAELADLLVALGEEEAQTLEALGRPQQAEAARRQAAERRLAVLSDLVAEAGPGECFTIARATREGVPEVARLALVKAGEFAAEEEEAETADWAALAVGLAWQSYAAARRVTDPEEASAALETARSLIDGHPEEEAGVLLDLAELAGERDDQQALEEHFEAAVELYREAESGFDQGYALLLWGRARFGRGDHDGAAALFEERLDLLEDLPEPEPRAIGITWHDLGNVRRARGERRQAIEAYRAGAAAKREAGSTEELALTLVVLGDALNEEGEDAEALSVFEEALALLRSQERPGRLDQERVLLRIGDLHASLGEARRAAAVFVEAAELARRSGDDRRLTVVLFQLGRALQVEEEFAAAEQAYRERLDLLRGLEEREPRAEGIALHDLGEMLRAQERLGEALEMLGEAARVAREAGELDGAAFSLLALAQTHEEADEPEAAETAYRERLELLRSLPEREPREEGQTLRALGELAEARGEGAAALVLQEEALTASREQGDPDHIAVALVGLAASRVRLSRKTFEDPTSALLEPTAAPATTGALIAPGTAASVVPELSEAEALGSGLGPLTMAAVRTLLVVAGGCLPEPLEHHEARTAAEATIAATIEAEQTEIESVQTACLMAGQLGRFDLARLAFDRLTAAPPGEAGVDRLQATLRRLGRFAERASDLEAAAELFAGRLERLRAAEEQHPIAEGVALVDLANVARRRGDLALAAELYREAAKVRHEAGRAMGEGRALYWLALVLRAESEPEAASKAATEALGRFREAEPVEPAWVARALLAGASVKSGPAAEELTSQAETILEDAGIDGEEAARLAEVVAALRDGRPGAPEVEGA